MNFKYLIQAFPNVYENYINNKWLRNQVRYRTVTDGELVDVRTTLTPINDDIIAVGKNIAKNFESNDDKALACLRKVMATIVYRSDMIKNGKPEFWQSPAKTFVDGSGDCEDGALLLMTIMESAGIPAWRRKICCGYVLDPVTKKKGGHAYVIYLKDNLNWMVLDWCYYPLKCIENYNKGIPHSRQKDIYFDIWWTFNSQFSWSQKDTIMR